MTIKSPEADIAEMLKWLERRQSRSEREREPEGSVAQLRDISDTELTSDSLSHTSGTDVGWVWGGTNASRWGFEQW